MQTNILSLKAIAATTHQRYMFAFVPITNFIEMNEALILLHRIYLPIFFYLQPTYDHTEVLFLK